MVGEKTILVTGGAGYIGSHTVVELLSAGLRVVVVDDLSNAKEGDDDDNTHDHLPPSLWRAKQIAGKGELHFFRVSTCDYDRLNEVFESFTIDTVFDFCGRKAVGESTRIPIQYYRDNLKGTTNVVKCMQKHGTRHLVFSSSCTVYGAPDPGRLPIKESDPVGDCRCPYAKCKLMVENLLQDMCRARPDYWRVVVMRYFNPVGAHESGLLGEDPKGNPQNLMPKLAQVAIGKQPIVEIFGDDYDTNDGSAIRDYVHIVDVAKAHCKTVEKFKDMSGGQVTVYNIGSGVGRSTLEMLRAFERACGRRIPSRTCPRRPGDVPAIYCDPGKAEQGLGWRAERTHEQMCADLWRFYRLHPNGYGRDSLPT